ncbi:hypothetical protein [Streptomyces sp. YIM 121038]|uniref:hypothetical protein n=1 Tax=Streptomyces sp. YIM 121038 TaxID=2136401 RepID=UPI001110FA9B|nr:hypothetical protein [Streptomyces sp. YIM 121038]
MLSADEPLLNDPKDEQIQKLPGEIASGGSRAMGLTVRHPEGTPTESTQGSLLGRHSCGTSRHRA